MRVVITGGSGFIGTNLIQKLIEIDAEIVNLDIQPPQANEHEKFWRQVSLLNRDEVSAALAEIRPEYVIHAAARTDIDGLSLDDYIANTAGSLNLIEAIKRISTVKRIVFLSTMLVCKNGHSPADDREYCPDTAYGQSKVKMEQDIRNGLEASGPEFVIVRPTSVWGPWFAEPYLRFFRAVQKGLYVHPGRLEVKKQFAYVGNVVNQVITLMLAANAADCSGKVFYVGDYSPYTVRNWADLIQRELGARRIRTVPLRAMRMIARVGDVFKMCGWRKFPLNSFRLSNMLKSNPLPFENTERVCGPLQYSIVDGTRETIAWMQKRKM